MKMQRTVLLIIAGVFMVVGGIYVAFRGNAPERNMPGSQVMTIIEQWDMPDELEEISGISFIDDNRVACVQDEKGVVFIYNLKTSKVEKKIDFGDSGDYEGITMVGTTCYVLRSDGVLFKIEDLDSDPKETVKIETSLKSEYNFEGLCYDKKNDQLLLAIKDKASDDFKPVYAFDLNTNTLKKDPVFTIPFNSNVFDKLKEKRSNKLMRPSDLAINPKDGKVYITEGSNPKLLITSTNGTPEKLYVLKEKQFAQPEGVTFNSKGEIFISNEGHGGPGNIIKLTLK